MSQILYISKYALTPSNPVSTRQYYFSKYFTRLGKSVTLISSQSSGHPTDLSKYLEFESYFEANIEGVRHQLIKGKNIGLGFSYQRILSWILFELRLWRHLKRFIKVPPEVIIVSSLSLLTILNGVWLKRKTGCKLVFEVRDIWPLTLVEIGKFSKYNPLVLLLGFIEKFGYRNADLIVGTMPKLNNHIKQLIQSPFKFAYVPMGYDSEFYTDIPTSIPEKYKRLIPENKFIATYAGAIGKVNLVEEIVEAANILDKRDTNIYFMIIGDGPLKAKVEKEAGGLSNIVFIPKIDKKYLNSILSCSSLLLHPVNNESIYRFGISPNKWIDYMYSKKPILVSYGGFPTIINDASCGKFIEPNNPSILAQEIEAFSKMDLKELNEMGENGFRYLINELSYENLSVKYLKFISDV